MTPHPDLPTIRARHERDERHNLKHTFWGEAHADRAALLAEVERLRAVVDAARRLQDEPHHVVFHETGWELEHNLPCRVVGMRTCEIHQRIKKWTNELDGPPDDPGVGRFQVETIGAASLSFKDAKTEDAAKELAAALAKLEEIR